MPRRLLLALLLLVAAPLALLGWVSSTTMRQQTELAREQLQTVLRSRLAEIDRTLTDVLDQHLRQLSGKLDRPTSVAAELRLLEQTDPIVRRGILVDGAGTLIYPPQPRADFSDQVAFYASLPAMIDSRPNELSESAEEQLQQVDPSDSPQQVSQKPFQQTPAAIRAPSANIQRLSRQQQMRPVRPAIGTPQWQVWYLDEGSQLVLWFPMSDGSAAGIMLERARWISDLTAALPDTMPATETSNSSLSVTGETKTREPQTPGFTALVDESAQIIYRWGDEGERTESPLATIPLSPPLSSWHLEYHAEESLLPKANVAPLYASLAGLAVALIGLGGYVLTSVQRQMQTARSRVSFAGQVSHELRTPLTNIQLYAELAESDLEKLPDDQIRSTLSNRLGVIDTECQRLGRLVSGVLEMIRDDRKQRGPKIVVASPDEWIDRTLHQFEPSFEKAGIQVVRTSNASQEVGFDPDILEMVLINLLSNVEKYASDGKQVTVSSHLSDQELTVTVGDNGPGIPRRHHRSVFRAFSRLDDSISAPSGTGIGLTIARRAAKRHGGNLRLITSDRGCCFELRLPVER